MTTSNQITLQHIDDFFTIGKQPVVVYNPATATKGAGLLNPASELSPPEPKKKEGSEYATRYREEETHQLFDHIHKATTESVTGEPSSSSNFGGVDDVTTAGGSINGIQDFLESDPVTLYNSYYGNATRQITELPITPYKEKIIRMINIHTVVIVQGPTGCGKTTQIPQYILERHLSLGVHCNIIVTQPRRIAAMSVARRVCQERGWELGKIVGYQVAMDSLTSSDTRLTYVTTGVLLQKLIANKHMNMYTHIVIDEVHERDKDTDLVLLLVKRFLRTNSKGVKVILMSATFNVEIFEEYFATPVRGKLKQAPVFNICEKPYNITEFYIDSLERLGPLPEFDPDVPCLPLESMNIAYELLKQFDRIEVIQQEEEGKKFATNRGSVLIFLPGFEEISRMAEMLQEERTSLRWRIIPLHSSITMAEQAYVFHRPEENYRKIILSTNIAESSITVPDIKYVIDFCLTKCLMCDPETNYSYLQLCWASKSNCKQRRGRAGRVSEGRVYHMVPEYFFETYLPDFGVPEIKRCPLEQCVLSVKRLDQGEPKVLLALALDPPDLTDIENAILVLKEVGALAITANGKITPFDGDLLFVGQIMSSLPLDVRTSKLIVLGYVLDCLEECLIIAACISLQSIFSKPFQKVLQSYKSRLAWAEGTFSDCLAYLNAYRVWQSLKQRGYFGSTGGMSKQEWGRRNFIQCSKMEEAERLVKELTKRLETMHIRLPEHPSRRDAAETVLMIKVAICGAFYPHYFLKLPLDEVEINRTLNTKNPLTTVLVSGLPQNQGLLYVKAIQDLLSPCGSNVQIEFEERKAYVEFQQYQDDDCTGVITPVYLAVKMRQLRMPLTLRLYQPEEAERKLKELITLRDKKCKEGRLLRSNRISVEMVPKKVPQVPLPTIGKNVMTIKVTCVINCGHFWAQYHDPEIQMQLNFIEQAIALHPKRPVKTLTPGSVVLAPFSESARSTPQYYRARVEELTARGTKVFFLDYGNTDVIKSGLCEIDEEATPELINTPAQAFECFLSEIKPSTVRSTNQAWTAEAKKEFQSLVAAPYLLARVYSVVQSQVRLELVLRTADGQELSINNLLIQSNHAERAEETLLSKQNHEVRAQYELESMRTLVPDREDNSTNSFVKLAYNETMQAAELSFSSHKVQLKGPSTPLEVSFNGITRLAFGRPVHFDRDSVNSVSLDSEPQEHYNQLLVACHVGISPSGSSISVRNTTLMPNIRGFPAIMSLIFCPYAELRIDPNRVRYTGALCGLGYDPFTKESLYKDHDIELTFDVAIEQTDIAQINIARMIMNILLGGGEEFTSWGPTVKKSQERLRNCILDLLKKNRKLQEPQETQHPYRWNRIPSEFLLDTVTQVVTECSQVYPLHKAVNLAEDVFIESLRTHIRELHALASRSEEPEKNHCRLCSITCYSPRELLLHLSSSTHRQKEVEVFC